MILRDGFVCISLQLTYPVLVRIHSPDIKLFVVQLLWCKLSSKAPLMLEVIPKAPTKFHLFYPFKF